jgi:hypothetical protein
MSKFLSKRRKLTEAEEDLFGSPILSKKGLIILAKFIFWLFFVVACLRGISFILNRI